MDLTQYRQSDLEKARTADLLRLLPSGPARVIDIGARDGHFSVLMADRGLEVTALDLSKPEIDHTGVTCVAGDATHLTFPSDHFNLVFCAEVLEHIPEPALTAACKEMSRVSAGHILLGVPFRQDIRVGRTTCASCGGTNPPWGHVNSFDLPRIKSLFPDFDIASTSFVGAKLEVTNSVSAFLLDFAGNPYGTYEQEEPCIHCGAELSPPKRRNAAQLVATKLAFWLRKVTQALARPRANWIHVLMKKRHGPEASPHRP